jgi:hypothetical protein
MSTLPPPIVTPAYLRANAAKWTGGSYTGLVATRAKAPNLSSTTKQGMMRSLHIARQNITSIGAAFANWYVSTSGENIAGGRCTITASVEYPLGTSVTRLTFGGNSNIVAQDWQTVMSDLVAVFIPSGATFGIREYRSYPGGGGIVYTDPSIRKGDYADGECYQFGTSGISDLTGTAGSFTSTDTANKPFTAPVAIFGPTNNPSYALIGDSRAEGYGDNPSGAFYNGALERAVGPLRPYTNLARYGETGAIANSQFFEHRASIIRTFCTHIICDYGINDIFGSGAFAYVVMQNLQSIRAVFPNHWFSQTTLEPETNSTDTWATTGNQTTKNSTYESSRQWFNNFLRGIAGMGTFDAVYDVASIVESGLNTGLWSAPGYTADGVHETTSAYAAIASSGIIKVS